MHRLLANARNFVAGFGVAGLAAVAVGVGGLVLGAPLAMPLLVAGACTLGAAAVGVIAVGRQDENTPFKPLSFAAGFGAAAFCMFTFGGTTHEAQQARNKAFTETKALVTAFERAVTPEYNNVPLPPASARPDPNTGWVGQAPGK